MLFNNVAVNMFQTLKIQPILRYNDNYNFSKYYRNFGCQNDLKGIKLKTKSMLFSNK